jgi:hypothetical protein
VPSLVDDDQLGARPGAPELVRVSERRLKVEAAVHEHAGDGRQPVGVLE